QSEGQWIPGPIPLSEKFRKSSRRSSRPCVLEGAHRQQSCDRQQAVERSTVSDQRQADDRRRFDGRLSLLPGGRVRLRYCQRPSVNRGLARSNEVTIRLEASLRIDARPPARNVMTSV